MDSRARNSRWTRDPVRNDDGSEVVAYPTDRDIEVFKLLAHFHYLPADYIHAFVGGNPKALSRRLNLLSRVPNSYLARPPQQRQSAAANHRPLIYMLDDRGARVLRERGAFPLPKLTHRNFAHELMVAQIGASIELGAREHRAIRVITWPEILANDKTPRTTRETGAASIRVAYSVNSENCTTELTADGFPFGLERALGGSRSYLFFPGIEADCGTEPIDPRDWQRSSIAKKFAAYTAIAQQGLYRSHFGFPNFFVPFITTTRSRMESIMRLLERITDGHGSKMFLFKTFPLFTSAEKPPLPTGHMLTAPWERAGFPPFHLDR